MNYALGHVCERTRERESERASERERKRERDSYVIKINYCNEDIAQNARSSRTISTLFLTGGREKEGKKEKEFRDSQLKTRHRMNT